MHLNEEVNCTEPSTSVSNLWFVTKTGAYPSVASLYDPFVNYGRKKFHSITSYMTENNKSDWIIGGQCFKTFTVVTNGYSKTSRHGHDIALSYNGYARNLRP
jgi:hypothetical protein